MSDEPIADPAFGGSCPLPLSDYPTVQMAHGGGGRLSQQLIEGLLVPAFDNAALAVLHDGAVVTGRIDMSQAAVRRHAQRFDPLVIPPRPGMRKVLRKRSAPR